ncbi:MAG: TIGR03435 family protein [Candidatus Solibacter sp.]|nr:TIGR03435 family protein [Candidatus Solibacter sp.]
MLPATFTLVLFAATAAFGQSADTPALAFDVASVKASQPGTGGGRGRRENIQFSPGAVTMRNVNLKSAIRWAWRVSEFQVSGPDWLDSERYEIAGKAAGPATEEQLRLMMQTLLRERFKLALHRQTKELSAYVLVVGKNGLKVPESKTEGETSIDINQRQLSVSVQRAPVSQLVDMLSNVLRAPVVDMTGLTGRYDVSLNVAKYVADMTAQGKSVESTPMDTQALISMVLPELGLKLEAKKMPLDLLIVDRAEKVPVEN